MKRIHRWAAAGAFLFALLIVPATGFGQSSELYDCGKRNCTEWAPNGENTCRTCRTAQCKKQGGSELLVGEKKSNECYEGHGPPPEDEEASE
jgi:hypothetical protein